MNNDPTNPVPVLGALVFACVLVGILFLIGCAVEWTTTQRIDWFNRDHSRHETNAAPAVP